jgi:hypothetical protein
LTALKARVLGPVEPWTVHAQLRFRDTPQRVLRASAMMLNLAACTPHESDRVEAVDLDVLVAKPPAPDPEFIAAGGISNGKLPNDDRRPREPRQTAAAKLMATALYTPEVDKRKVRATEAARKRRDSEVTISFCVDPDGKVFDVERVRGDRELSKLLIENVEQWRFRRRQEANTICIKFDFRFRFV